MSIHSASRVSRVVSFVGLRLASQASRVYLRVVPIHTATGVASHVYSISRTLNVVSRGPTGGLPIYANCTSDSNMLKIIGGISMVVVHFGMLHGAHRRYCPVFSAIG